MKNKLFFLKIYAVVILFILPGINLKTGSVESQFILRASSENSIKYDTSDLTYERVFKDGIWWIYVYDNLVLVHVYEE